MNRHASAHNAVLAVALALLLAACRRFEPVPLSATDAASALEQRSLADPGLHAFFERVGRGPTQDWPRTRWDLETLTLVALYYQPSLAVARAQWRVAEAGVLTAGARPNPSLSITPQYVANSPAAAVPWVVTAALDWPIETAGKRGYRIDRAQQIAISARLALDAAAWKVRTDVRARLLDLVAAGAHTALLARERAVRHEVAELLEQRERAGAASNTEGTTARVAALQAGVDLAEAERQQHEARVGLATAVGLPVRALDDLEMEFPLEGRVPADRPDDDLRRDALQRRPDVLAALADYAASQAALQLEIARQYPDLRIGPGYEYDQGLNKWAVVGVSVELPVLNRNQGPIGEAEALRAAAAARFTEVQATVLDALDRALGDRERARRTLERADSLWAAERQRLHATAQVFEAGAADRLALHDAELTSLQTERIRLDAQIQLQRALGDLEAAVQLPLEAGPVAVEEGKP